MQLTEQNAKSALIEGSYKKAVFCYFYVNAPECQAATNALTSVIKDDNQYITLLMANVDEQVSQAIAVQIGLRGVPALIVFKDGQPADALQGDDIVNKLHEVVSKYMPSEAQLTANDAIRLEEEGNLQAACEKAQLAHKLDDKNLDYKHLYVHLLIKLKNLDKAKELLDAAGREEREGQEYQDLVSALNLALKAQESPELKELEGKYKANPGDDKTLIKYAVALKESGKASAALEILFARLQKALDNEEVKKVFLDMLNTMSGDPLQGQYRRKLYNLMY